MPWHNFTLTTVTPLFIGAADRTPAADDSRLVFPAPSLRGALRYWLRTLLGAHLANDLNALSHAEALVFGASAVDGDPTRGRSPIALRSRGSIPFAGRGDQPDWMTKGAGVRYLLGPGVNRKPGEGGLRGHVKAGQDMPFAAKLTGNDAKADLFLSSLWALRTFGGLGARARRGFGTIEVTTPPDLPTASFDRAWLERNHATDLHAVLTCVSEALRSLNVVTALPDNDQPKYPSFRGGWYQLSDRQYATSAGDFANELSAVGDRLRKRRVDSDEPRASSVEYRDIVRPFMDNNQPSSTTPFSIGAFGLPVVFSRPKPPAQATVHAVHNGERIRRASPLWLRIYENRTTTQRPRWQCRSLAFDAEWLPQGAELSVENERGAKPVVIPNTEQLKSALNRWFT